MTTPLNVLLVEDSPDDAELVLAELRRAGFAPDWRRVETEADFLAEMAGAPDIILSDYSLPRFNGLSAARLLRESGLNIPFILISGTVGEEVAVESMKHGATDYLLKDRLARLGPAVEQALEQTRLRQERRQAAEALRGSEEKFRSAFATASVGLAITTPEGKYLETNATYCAILGYTHEELTSTAFRQVIHEDDVTENMAVYRRMVAGEIPGFVIENRYIHRNGSPVWVRKSVSVVRGPDGRALRIIALIEDIGDRRRAEQELRESEELNRAVLNSMQAHIAVLDRDGNIVAVNDAWRQFARQNAAGRPALIARTDTGTNYLEICRSSCGRYAEEAAPAEAGVRAVLSGEKNDFQLEYPCHSQEVRRWFILSATPLKSDRGGAVVSHINITARREAEDSLKLFRRLVDHSNDSIEVIDPVTARILDVNETTCQRLGYTRAELLAMTVPELDPGGVTAADWPAMVEQIRQSEFSIVKGVHRRKDGSTFPIEANIRFVRADRDYLIAVVRDITSRLRSEQALRESEEKFRQLAENINEVFWITSPNLEEMIYVSPAYEKIWGRTCASLQQNPHAWIAAIHAEDRPRIQEATRTKMARGEFDVTYRIHRPDGATRWVHDRGYPVRNAAGEIYRIVGVAEDITEQRQLEEQFRQAQKMEGIGQLAGGVAHDFNNILAIIQMQAELLQSSGPLSDRQAEFASEIGASVTRGAALTRQLLLFSRRETFQPRDLDLGEAVTGTAKLLRRILGENVEMQLKLAAQPLFIHADAGMMDQVLMNLAVNARDAMPGGGRLSVGVHGVNLDEFAAAQIPSARPGSFARLSVSDSGCGIPPEILPKIFEPFFTTKDVGKGTGLGLATVFGIVQQHQGWINVQSTPGKGTTFQIFLPRVTESAGTTAPSPTLAAVCGGPETILLVEDDPSLRVSVRVALAQLGYRILEAPTGIKALEVWRQNQGEINLLLTDLVMPDGMNGKELAQRLRQEKPALKVVYMSGYSTEVVGKGLVLNEGVNYLAKPFKAVKLTKIIRQCLDAPALSG